MTLRLALPVYPFDVVKDDQRLFVGQVRKRIDGFAKRLGRQGVMFTRGDGPQLPELPVKRAGPPFGEL